MNDAELQSLWQAQPQGLPVAFTPAELERRAASAGELLAPTSAFEEARLSRRVAAASLRATLALASCALLLAGAVLLRAAWLAGLATGALVVLAWQARRAVLDNRALTALQCLRERPRASSPTLRPFAALAAVALALLMGVVAVQNKKAQRAALARQAALAACQAGAKSAHVSDETADACQEVLDAGVLQPEATRALHDVIERHDCQAPLASLAALTSASDVEAAGLAWSALPPACQRRFEPRRPGEEVLLALGNASRPACAAALAEGKDEGVVRACEPYALVACRAPALDRPRAGDTFDFRRDALLVRFLTARDRVGAPAWRCPHRIEPERPPATPFAFAAWPEALQPVLDAWMDGAEERAEALLESAEVPADVRADFTREFTDVRKQYASARASLSRSSDAPEDTARLVRAALDADARLLFRGEPSPEQLRSLGKYVQSPRVQLSRALASAEYERGIELADRKDFRRACLAWKRGLHFSFANVDLLRAATNVCTARARKSLDAAQTCDELREVLDYAVDGDGLAREARERLAAAGCG